MRSKTSLAKAIIAEAQEDHDVTPESLGRLGWWYYRAGNYAMSRALLGQALAVRPGNLSVQTAVAWNELEQHQFENAIRHFTGSAGNTSWASPMMGRAVARWQAGQTEDAVKDFESVTTDAPEWHNPRWVRTLFPASVAQGVAAMDAEWQKRQTSRR